MLQNLLDLVFPWDLAPLRDKQFSRHVLFYFVCNAQGLLTAKQFHNFEMKAYLAVVVLSVIFGYYYYNPQLVTKVDPEFALASSLEKTGNRFLIEI